MHAYFLGIERHRAASSANAQKQTLGSLFFILISGSGFNIRHITVVSYYDPARCRSIPAMLNFPLRSRSGIAYSLLLFQVNG
jgi:hypothetical protein